VWRQKQGLTRLFLTVNGCKHLEAMGKSRLPGTAQTWSACARSMEHQQEQWVPLCLVANLALNLAPFGRWAQGADQRP
jgi:hypothetical protein